MILKKTWADGQISHFYSHHKTFSDFVNENLKDKPEDVFVTFDDKSMTAEFDSDAGRQKIVFEYAPCNYLPVCPG